MGWTAPRTWSNGETVTATILNTHVRDNFNAVGDHETWTSHTPTLTASTSNPTLGSGSTQSGQYIQTGKIVHYQFYIQFGTSGTAAGSGTYRVSLPVNAATTVTNAPAGSGLVFDNSLNDRYVATIYIAAATYCQIYWDQQTDVGNVTDASPFAWAASDAIRGELIYRAA